MPKVAFLAGAVVLRQPQKGMEPIRHFEQGSRAVAAQARS